MYLIMKCEELHDQYECDVNRIPVAITPDWEKWIVKNEPTYNYEVWSYSVVEGTFSCIKNYNDYFEKGMAFYWWNEGENPEEDLPHVIAKFPNTNRNDKIPKIVEKAMIGITEDKNDFDNELDNCGYITWWDDDKYYIYGEYSDNRYSWGY